MNHPFYECKTCKTIFRSKDKYRNPKYCTRKCYGDRELTEEDRLRFKNTGFRVGGTPWNKGVKMWEGKEHPRGTLGKKNVRGDYKFPEESRKKMRDAHKGIKLPERSKENHWNWQNGKTSKTVAIRSSSDYKNWRTSVFERDKYTCVLCSKQGGYLHADHIVPFSIDEKKVFDLDNGRTLCKSCHQKTDSYGGKIHKLLRRLKKT